MNPSARTRFRRLPYITWTGALVATLGLVGGKSWAGDGAPPADGGLGDFKTDMKAVKLPSPLERGCADYAFWQEKMAENSDFLKDVALCRGPAPGGTDPTGVVKTALGELGKVLLAHPNYRSADGCTKARGKLAPPPQTPAEDKPVGTEPSADAKANDDKIRAASEAVKKATVDVQQAMESLLQPRDRSAQTFESMVLDPPRLVACGRITKTIAELFDSPLGPLADEVDRQRSEAHATDVFRKAESLETAVSAGNALTEIAGSPDKIVMGIMAALGAEEKSDGNRLVMTVNLASLFASESERVKDMAAWQRNLMLRAVLPLDSTDTSGAAVAGAASNKGSRLTLQVGGDVVNSSDPRLPENKACYLAALAYVPVFASAENAASFASERATYVDMCHKLAAARQRLAWRAGVGLLTEAAATDSSLPPKTRVELYGGAVLWAPSTALTTNLIYQHLRIPTVVDTFGAGFSFGRNVGGPASGVNAWGRLALDALGFAQRQAATNGDSADWQWQARVGVTLRGRIAGGAFTTVSVGPRFLGDRTGDVDLLSTVSFTYDIDQLFGDIAAPLPLLR